MIFFQNLLISFKASFYTPAAYVIYCTVAVLAVCCILVKINRLEKNIAFLGCLFGLVACASEASSAYFFHHDTNTIISIVNAPSIVASFCFNPLAGLIAGGIATIGHVIVLLFWKISDFWYFVFSSAIIFVVSLYAAALRYWIFDNRQPLILTATLAGVFGEILRLGLLTLFAPFIWGGKSIESNNDAMNSLTSFFPAEKLVEFQQTGHGILNERDVDLIGRAIYAVDKFSASNYSMSGSLEILFSHLPYLLWGMAFAVIVCSLITFPYKGKDKDFYSIRLPALGAFVFLAILFCGVMFFSLNDADIHTRRALLEANQTLMKETNDRIGYMMLTNSRSLARTADFQDISHITAKKLKEYAVQFNFDEISIFDSSGNLVETSIREQLQPDAKKITDIGFWRRYQDLQNRRGSTSVEVFDSALRDDKYLEEDDDNWAKTYAFVHTTPDGRKWTVFVLYSWMQLTRECISFFEPLVKRARFRHSGQILAIRDTKGADGKYTTRVLFPIYRFPQAVGKKAEEIGFTDEMLTKREHSIFEAEICNVWHVVNPFERICINGNVDDKLKIFFALPYSEYYYGAARQISISGLVLLLLCVAFNIVKIKFTRKKNEIDRLRAQEMHTAFTIQDAELQDDWIGDGYPCDIISTITPAREVGGDFYDYYMLPDGRVAIAVADVSGKGVSAAFFMMRAKYILKSCMMSYSNLPEAVTATTQALCDHNDAQMFVTAWIGVFDPGTGSLEYVSAGHNPPLVKHADGSVEWIRGTLRKKPPLATFRQVKYQSEILTLAHGDVLFLYTDGVTEAMNSDGELFGEARLEAALEKADGKVFDKAGASLSLNEIIKNNLKEFSGMADQSDDITILTMEVKQ